jgi:hypothetical protein
MKPSALHRMAFRVLSVLAGCLLLATAWAPAARAGSCASGNLSGLIGETCDVGSLQFTFDELYSDNFAYDGSTYTYGTSWTANNFTFTPVSNGFSLSFNGGPQSLTTTSDGFAYDYAYLVYSVTDLAGNFTGESATGGAPSSSAGEDGGYGNALIEGVTYSSTETPYVVAYQESFDGSPCELQNYLAGSPFSDGTTAYAYPFYLFAEEGGSAGWDGNPSTFTYDTTSSTTPEPASLLLFGTALLGIAFITRKNLAH